MVKFNERFSNLITTEVPRTFLRTPSWFGDTVASCSLELDLPVPKDGFVATYCLERNCDGAS